MKYIKFIKYLAIFFVAIFVLYLLVGFFFSPYIVTQMLPNYLKKALHVNIHINKASFNPLTFKLNLQNFTLNDQKNKHVFSFIDANISLNATKLFQKSIQFDNILLNNPHVNVVIDKNSNLNVLNILPKNSIKKEKNNENSKWNFDIKSINILNARFSLYDEKNNYKFNLSHLNYKANNLSSKKETLSTQKLHIEDKNHLKMSYNGNLSIDPLSTKGTIKINNLVPNHIIKYFFDNILIQPRVSLIDIKFNYEMNFIKNTYEIKLKDIFINFDDVNILRNNEKIASLINLKLNNFDILIRQNDIQILKGKILANSLDFFDENVNLKSDHFALNDVHVFYKNEKINLNSSYILSQNIILDLQKIPLNIKLDKLNLNNIKLNDKFNFLINDINISNLYLQNKTLTKPSLHVSDIALNDINFTDFNLSISSFDINNSFSNITLANKNKFDFLQEFNATTSETNSSREVFNYKIKNINLNNFDINFTDKSNKNNFNQNLLINNLLVKNISNRQEIILYDLTSNNKNNLSLNSSGQILLKPFELNSSIQFTHNNLSHFQPYIDNFKSLHVNKGKVNIDANINYKNDDLNLLADVKFNDFDIKNNENKLLFSNLFLNKIAYSQPKNTLHVNSIALNNPKVKFVLQKSDETNTSTGKKTKNNENKFDFLIDTFDVKNAQISLVDLYKKSFNIHSLYAKFTPISLKKLSHFKANATIDKNGYFDLKGHMFLNDFKKQSSFESSIKNLPLGLFSSYFQKYLGYEINQGSLTSHVTQNIQKAKLNGENKIDLDGLILGQKVKSKDALNLPLELALVLLKDNQGNIQLDIPVTGDMNDPNFSYGSVVITALTNVLTSVVSAPFSILGNLLGIDGAKLQSIDFEPSSDKIISSEYEKMKHYSQLLQKKPKLSLSITGTYDENIDLITFDDQNNSIKAPKIELEALANKRVQMIIKSLQEHNISSKLLHVKSPISQKAKQGKWIGSKIDIAR